MSWKPRGHRDAAMRAIGDDLPRWTCGRHASDHPLDRRPLRDRSLELAGEYGLTDFKCSEKWLTWLPKKYPLQPVFGNYRLWVDMMRSVIVRHKCKDLFHPDELMMCSDVSPSRVSSAIRDAAKRNESNMIERATVLISRNASGTEKLPLLICDSYPAAIAIKDHTYRHSEDASVDDGLLEEWLSRLNEHLSRSNRKILCRHRTNVFRHREFSNIRPFPVDFSPLLRPLKRDVSHIKMIRRNRYAEEIGHGRRRNVENVVSSLVKVPRALIIAGFQRTNSRTDDCLLEIRCDAWDNLATGLSFKKFVTFDDELDAPSRKKPKSCRKSHGYHLRTKEIALDVDRLDCIINSRAILSESQDRSRTNGSLKKGHAEANADQERSSLKRSYDEAHLDQDQISKSNEDIDIASSPAKLLKISNMELADETVKLIDETADCEKKSTKNQALSNERLTKRSQEAEEANVRSITPLQVSGDCPVEEQSNNCSSEEANAACEVESADLEMNGNDNRSSLKSRKRRRSCSAEEPRSASKDEPERKRPKTDSDWTKQYKTTFVFGSPTVFADAIGGDNLLFDGNNLQRVSLRPRSRETEKSIFTIRPGKN